MHVMAIRKQERCTDSQVVKTMNEQQMLLICSKVKVLLEGPCKAVVTHVRRSRTYWKVPAKLL